MDTDVIFAIAGVGLTVAVINLLLNKSGRDDAALGVTLAGIIAVVLILIREISALFELLKLTFSLAAVRWIL